MIDPTDMVPCDITIPFNKLVDYPTKEWQRFIVFLEARRLNGELVGMVWEDLTHHTRRLQGECSKDVLMVLEAVVESADLNIILDQLEKNGTSGG